MHLPAKLTFSVLLTLLPLCVLLSIAVGAVALPLNHTLAVLMGQSDNDQARLIIQHIRIPRTLLAILLGALLGVGGAAMQGLFRNPLADPSLIGVTAGATLGASIAIVLGGTLMLGYLSVSLISIGAFVGGVIAVLIVYHLATNQHGTSVATMLLAGIAITALAASINNLMEFIADNEMLRNISLWRMGGLDGANYPKVMLAALVALPVLCLLPLYANALNAMLLGESQARYLGINVRQVKQHLVILVAAGTGVSVALAGTIAFVGLVVPHIMRLLLGPNHRTLLPASAMAGAILLLLADILARIIIAPVELPVGLVTAMVGAPFFIVLLKQRYHTGRQL